MPSEYQLPCGPRARGPSPPAPPGASWAPLGRGAQKRRGRAPPGAAGPLGRGARWGRPRRRAPRTFPFFPPEKTTGRKGSPCSQRPPLPHPAPERRRGSRAPLPRGAPPAGEGPRAEAERACASPPAPPLRAAARGSPARKMAAPGARPAVMFRLLLRGASALAGGGRPGFVAAAEARQGLAIPSHLDDLPPTMLKKDYANVSAIDKVDDVVRRMLSLEMASQREKVKMKKEQLADKVRRSPNDCGSAEVQVAYLTAMIRTLKEHLHNHPKDKVNLCHMMIAIDRRNVLLKYLRNNHYDIFENTCKQLEIEYSPPPQYRRKITRRMAVKKELHARVYKEKQKLRALERLKQIEKQREGAKEQAQPKGKTPV
ncbi:small ribosomal subunit protein uS15m isoform 2-T2 [Liasis olivaceus]